MHVIYNALLYLVTIVCAPLLIILLLVEKRYRAGFFQKFGLYSWKEILSNLSTRPLWIHAVSVGEVMTAIPFIKEIKRLFPQIPVILSTGTATGRHIAKRNSRGIDHIIFFPFDYPFIVKLFISRLRPLVFIALETELWPNFLRELKQRTIPALIISGRISGRSFRNYRRFGFFFKQVLDTVACFCMQSPADAERIIAMGADKSRVVVTGNLKFDLPIPGVEQAEKDSLHQGLNLTAERRIFIAGSTHRGEEEIILDAYQALKKEAPDLALIIAPRHPERFGEVEALIQSRGFRFSRKTALENSAGSKSCDVILLDTVGELSRLYAIGTVIFVGGSLVPVGGHNVLEPAVFRRPVIFGPHMGNFSEIAKTLKRSSGAVQIHSTADLINQVSRLLGDASLRESLGANAFQVVARNSGALQRSMEIVRPVIEEQAKLNLELRNSEK